MTHVPPREVAALNAAWADALVGALCASGVEHAVISPGSRNTPIVLAVMARAERGTLRVHTILDERAAGFYALGLARITGAPVALSCTSGSAGAHWLPAVLEADHARLPLVLLTADRPPELHGAGAPQTTAQDHLFGRHVRHHANPGAPVPGDLAWLRTLAARAVALATGVRPGPVHLNLPFREPLWDAGLPALEPMDVAPVMVRGEPRLSRRQVADVAEQLASASRGVIALGPGDQGVSGGPRAETLDALARSARRLADTLGWPLIVDAASGLRFARPGASVVTTADLLTRTEAFKTTPPGAVLRVGQVPTSKSVAAWLAQAPAATSYMVDPAGDWLDPHHQAGRLLIAEPVALFDALADALESRPTRARSAQDRPWLLRWQAAEVTTLAALSDHDRVELWSGSVARGIVAALPEGALLHVASSLAVRAIDSFAGSVPRRVAVTANRGVNGIDGTLATALGEAAAWETGPVVAFVGDLAFVHDLGALLTCRAQADTAPTTVVVMDNRGGGIFDHLPIAGHPTAFEPCFVVDTCADIPALARAAGAQCATVTDRPGLDRALSEAVERPGVTVVHVHVDRAADLARHEQVRAEVATWIGGAS